MTKIKNIRFLHEKIKIFIKNSNEIEGEKGVLDSGSIKAIEILMNFYNTKNIFEKIELIKKAHFELMKGTNLKEKKYKKSDLGKFRNKNVYVGGRKCLEYDKIENSIEKWLKKDFKNKTYKHLLLKHKEFELIHPFYGLKW